MDAAQAPDLRFTGRWAVEFESQEFGVYVGCLRRRWPGIWSFGV